MKMRLPFGATAVERTSAAGRFAWWRASPLILTVMAALMLLPTSLPAQGEMAAAEEVGAASGIADSDATDVQVGASDPLPAPSFRRAYWHLFIAFGVAWALLLGYVVMLDRRIDQARRELERLGGEQAG